ncbi:hypothetical protein SODALDRAFT_360623 [Sodiomyces alkalinus F11]|uniref:Uncharacterized protein n=1 Tax=Sodiomyces alkalinus (strain CBS 110278 / VKM F-3762 / F11) TaxID=1314773 RepID=A0A3N2PUV2_SODAK|nr:hypothetical protein SODALDRAFT_360623 [Sodiomyces alkalinus F11]ROT38271.1 hypothetical protein SODALDRAFT_360623 [Sodiomyces alkalinus F11]
MLTHCSIQISASPFDFPPSSLADPYFHGNRGPLAVCLHPKPNPMMNRPVNNGMSQPHPSMPNTALCEVTKREMKEDGMHRDAGCKRQHHPLGTSTGRVEASRPKVVPMANGIQHPVDHQFVLRTVCVPSLLAGANGCSVREQGEQHKTPAAHQVQQPTCAVILPTWPADKKPKGAAVWRGKHAVVLYHTVRPPLGVPSMREIGTQDPSGSGFVSPPLRTCYLGALTVPQPCGPRSETVHITMDATNLQPIATAMLLRPTDTCWNRQDSLVFR